VVLGDVIVERSLSLKLVIPDLLQSDEEILDAESGRFLLY